MATTRSNPVTIDRAYFEALVRRANFNHNEGLIPADLSGAYDPSVTIISKTEYDSLLLVAPEETDDGGARLEPSLRSYPGNVPYSQSSRDYMGGRPYGSGVRYGSHSGGFGDGQTEKQLDWVDADGDYSPVYSADGPTPDPGNGRPQAPSIQSQNAQRPQFARVCRRTIALTGLPDQTTHKDVTNVVRGGMLLDIFLRAAEHVARVSFLREEDAVRFHGYARKKDIYIKNKRVFVRWDDRHFHLAGHVAGKIAMGATRNLIIRRCAPKHTADSIREDLDHIHNLIVIDVDFLGGSCYIKTNSVHNAMFARTCMMSRAKYKGSKIEWDVDECDQPIDITQGVVSKPQQPPFPKKPPVDIQNRFATLRLDDDDNDDDELDDKFDASSEFPAPSTVNVTA
ncbi:hypothetical protein DL764_004840 [Monosporascus ibericus]|uniref:RRM domain-containing protein n=1 Tax=Monosporascus ibericus TaxID=155417 RepID=A0A4Q4TB45_9PEZI|nr:hypothetical protein DL764_004840 [Monosporascus ibericus]